MIKRGVIFFHSKVGQLFMKVLLWWRIILLQGHSIAPKFLLTLITFASVSHLIPRGRLFWYQSSDVYSSVLKNPSCSLWLNNYNTASRVLWIEYKHYSICLFVVYMPNVIHAIKNESKVYEIGLPAELHFVFWVWHYPLRICYSLWPINPGLTHLDRAICLTDDRLLTDST